MAPTKFSNGFSRKTTGPVILIKSPEPQLFKELNEGDLDALQASPKTFRNFEVVRGEFQLRVPT